MMVWLIIKNQLQAMLTKINNDINSFLFSVFNDCAKLFDALIHLYLSNCQSFCLIYNEWICQQYKYSLPTLNKKN